MAEARRKLVRKILLPLDGSANAEAALPWVRRYAAPSKAEVVLLRVLTTEYPLRGPSFLAGGGEAEHYLMGIERQLNFDGIPVRTMLRNGAISRTILDTARKEGCDLIVITTRGASPVVRWLLGGVTEQVLRRSAIPVMVVRSGTTHRPGSHPERILVPLDGSDLAGAVLPWVERLAKFHRARVTLLHVRPRARSISFETPERISAQAAALRRSGLHAGIKLREGDPGEEILEACRETDLLAMTTHGYGGFKRWFLGSIAERVLREAPVPVVVWKGARPETRKGVAE